MSNTNNNASSCQTVESGQDYAGNDCLERANQATMNTTSAQQSTTGQKTLLLKLKIANIKNRAIKFNIKRTVQ